MANTACTIKHITLKTIENGSRYSGGIDMNGGELSDIQLTISTEPQIREYSCHNCKKTWDGSETFEEVKKHFGTFPLDNPTHPF